MNQEKVSNIVNKTAGFPNLCRSFTGTGHFSCRKALYKFCTLPVLAFFVLSCSSAPKRPSQISTTYNLAVNQLDMGNVESERGNYKHAENLLDEAWRLAVSVDSVELRILTQLSFGNLAFYQNNQTEAEKMWQRALDEANAEQNQELIALSKIYQSRGTLSWGSPADVQESAHSSTQNAKVGAQDTAQSNAQENARRVIQTVTEQMGYLKKSNQLYTAYAWLLLGFAKKQLGQWQQAEEHFKTAEKIHEDMLYLELAAYDWYAISSVRSVAGQYEQAVKAMQNAISFDRRAENTYGLGNDYLALSEIYKKAGKPEQSQEARNRSKEIFASSSLLNTPD
ncbi:MAG: tetratricopeptide repeat protein [Treponema sp.]|nr:tetratricopeptide repeat protein [Treponema sp.]